MAIHFNQFYNHQYEYGLIGECISMSPLSLILVVDDDPQIVRKFRHARMLVSVQYAR